MRLAANDSCLSGWLISRAITAAPVSDKAPAATSQMAQVLVRDGPSREASVRSQ